MLISPSLLLFLRVMDDVTFCSVIQHAFIEYLLCAKHYWVLEK